ncbi:MAG: TerC/Alx family metal homeostasis membrane protein [Bacteroidales bacterium]|jgi:tellurite resistance protein TerC|nr:TerC family protein [Bacteroidales bacterium]MDI9552766.1 TerC family protein [Bacteroidota bacterium]MZP64771.1 TerC/Alx family metal homeostasis membrane protein [Bacteroidales bacterium]NLK55156.1 TerC family protein [Bacteroidales bacterium]HPB12346.1 TerC family protein [Bacteroidales bacterium]
MEVSPIFWVIFCIIIVVMLALDLGVFNKKSHEIKLKEALSWVAVWVSLAMIFNLIILFQFGKTKALEFLTAYVIEYSLSIDNIFVFIMVFSFFSVRKEYQHKVLFWGILGAVIMRAIFIFAGVALINKFHWIVIIFGVFLVFTGLKMLLQKEEAKVEPEKNGLVRLLKKFLPVSDHFHGSSFFVKKEGKTYATPLFVVLLIIESTDLIFAVDSIPAVLAISKDTFIVFTSNIFAILGLRSLYFAISGIMGLFRFLKIGLALVLTFVGLKMLAAFFDFEIPVTISLSVIVSILLLSILASLIIKKGDSTSVM